MPTPRMLLRDACAQRASRRLRNAAGFRNRMPPFAGLIDLFAVRIVEHLVRALGAGLSVERDRRPS